MPGWLACGRFPGWLGWLVDWLGCLSKLGTSTRRETFILIVFPVISVIGIRKHFVLIVFSVFSVFLIVLVDGKVEMHCRQMGGGGLAQRAETQKT